MLSSFLSFPHALDAQPRIARSNCHTYTSTRSSYAQSTVPPHRGTDGGVDYRDRVLEWRPATRTEVSELTLARVRGLGVMPRIAARTTAAVRFNEKRPVE